MEKMTGEVHTSKTLSALERSIFPTLHGVKVRMRVALPSSLLKSRLPSLFNDCMLCISLLASSFWPEIPTKSVFIGRQGIGLQLPDAEWKLPENVNASSRAIARGGGESGNAVRLYGW